MGRKNSYHFGPYLLNANESVLVRDGVPVALTPKAFDTLIVLVRNSGHLVEKEQLMKEVWPETAVEDANLTQNIFTLRRILGDNDEGLKYIETVPRRGYRFVAPVREISEPEMDPVPKTGQVLGQDSVAVLPFVNASGDIAMEHLSDGITVSIINNLSQLPMLRVMSQTAVFRYKGKEQDAQQIGRELGVSAVLVGRINSHEGGLLISAELVDVANGWQLWGKTYDHPARAILGAHAEIARQISAALRSKLFEDDERRLSLRYTKNQSAYQSYLKGRCHWIKYDSAGLVQALSHFRDAISLDPYYILAYAGFVDCCLRLVTNYMPTEENQLSNGSKVEESQPTETKLARTIRLKYEWDQKAIERELKRAAELKTNFPAVHQWHAAFKFAMSLLKNNSAAIGTVPNFAATTDSWNAVFEHNSPFIGCSPTMAEEVQIFCAIAREQIESGNYEAASLLLRRWWVFGQWPRVDGLSPQSSSDLLFTAGALAGYQASARQVPAGQKHAEALLNGSIAIFEQLGSKSLAAHGRIELSWCYYREGLFGLACETLNGAIHVLADDEIELKSQALARLATIEHRLGRLHDARRRLEKLADIVELVGPLTACRYNLELATTLRELAISESRSEYFDRALRHFNEALYELDAVGHHRYAAIVENNHGYLLLARGRLAEAEVHLTRARSLFEVFDDREKQAQVDDTLARLHVAAKRFELADACISRSVEMLEAGGEDALLAQSLRTKGLVLCGLGRYRAAKKILERAQQVAEHCGDMEGAGRAILVLIEEMGSELPDEELVELASQVYKLLANSQMALIRERLKKTLDQVQVRTKSTEALD